MLVLLMSTSIYYIKNKHYYEYQRIIKAGVDRGWKYHHPDTERHHIHPESFGGDKSPENLVILTYQEHFRCHELLVSCTRGIYKSKMAFAFKKMIDQKHKGNHPIDADVYAELKRIRSDFPIYNIDEGLRKIKEKKKESVGR